LGVGADESYETKLSQIVDCQNHSIFVAVDVEYNPATLEDVRRSQLRLDLLRRAINGFSPCHAAMLRKGFETDLQ
jgi:hypothetical protein